MNSKKVGVALLILGALLMFIFIASMDNLTTKSNEFGCFKSEECRPIQTKFSFVNLGFGIFGFIFALGFYMVLFNKGEQEVINQLNNHKQKEEFETKFDILLRGLDEFEQEVIKAVRIQEGITQNTLRLRVDMSKAKLSQILSQLEKKKLVAREQQHKTLAIFTTLEF